MIELISRYHDDTDDELEWFTADLIDLSVLDKSVYLVNLAELRHLSEILFFIFSACSHTIVFIYTHMYMYIMYTHMYM